MDMFSYTVGCILGVGVTVFFFWFMLRPQPPAPDKPPQYTEGAAYDACLELEPEEDEVARRLLESCDSLEL